MFLKFWMAGTVFFAWHLHWITVISRWSNFFWGIAAWVLLSLGLGLFIGAAGAGYRWGSRWVPARFWPRAMLFAVLWVFFEWLHSVGPWGMPAGLLSTFLVSQPFWLQTLSLWGLWGQELLLVLALAAVFKLVLDGRARRWEALQNIILLAAFLSVFFYNLSSWQRVLPAHATLRVAVVQPNTPQEQKLNPVYFSEIENNLFKQTRLLLAQQKQPVDFVLWPETVIPRLLLNDPAFLKKLDELRVPVMLGVPHFDPSRKLHNLMVLYHNQGKQVYAKRHLVPFGEYLPLRRWLGWVGDPAFQFLDYSAGSKFQNLIQFRDHRLGTLICFESMFDFLARVQVRQGAQALILITNDAWFLKTAGVSQHARFLILRAIENRVPAIQLGNSGLSYWVNAKGQVLQKLPPFQQASAVWELPLGALK